MHVASLFEVLPYNSSLAAERSPYNINIYGTEANTCLWDKSGIISWFQQNLTDARNTIYTLLQE